MNKLYKHIQNTAARLITRTRKHVHITPVFRTLHWLLVPQRIKFKILLLTYYIIHHHAPSYLIDMISPKQATRMNLRSSTRDHILHSVLAPTTAMVIEIFQFVPHFFGTISLPISRIHLPLTHSRRNLKLISFNSSFNFNYVTTKF